MSLNFHRWFFWSTVVAMATWQYYFWRTFKYWDRGWLSGLSAYWATVMTQVQSLRTQTKVGCGGCICGLSVRGVETGGSWGSGRGRDCWPATLARIVKIRFFEKSVTKRKVETIDKGIWWQPLNPTNMHNYVYKLITHTHTHIHIRLFKYHCNNPTNWSLIR